MILAQTRHVETGRLLGWLAEVLKRSEAVTVKIDLADNSDEGLSLQITLPNVPTALAASRPEHDEKQLEIFHDADGS